MTRIKISFSNLIKPILPGRRFEAAVLITLFVLVNLVAFNLGFYRLDLTQDKRFSLSPVTRQILTQLPDQVLVKVYVSSKVPGKFVPLKNYVLTSLLTMQRISHGKLKVLVYDPDKDAQKQQEAKNYNLPEVEFTVIENDQFQTKKGYFGLVLSFTDRTETIPVFDKIDTFEYEFIRRLLKITASHQAKLYLSDNHQEKWDKSKFFRQELAKNYNLVNISIADQDLQNLDKQKAKAIFIYNPQSTWQETEIEKLKKWQAQNKNIVIFADGMSLDDNFMPIFNFAKHKNLLQAFQVDMPQKLLLAKKGEVISFTSPNIPFPVFQYYGFWLKAKPSDVNQDLAWKNDIIGSVFPWTSYLEFDAKNSDYTPIVTFKNINKVTCPCSIQPGTFKFDPSKTDQAVSALLYQPQNAGKVIILADADLAADDIIKRYPQNLKLALDLVDLLAFDERLILLRSKTILTRSLKDLSPSQKQAYKISILASPVLVLINLAALIYLLNRFYHKRLIWTE
ncbi:MAG: GldG family protein [bacterium]|nr:GldG family protein [bacterium]